jgi:hypothetical protein
MLWSSKFASLHSLAGHSSFSAAGLGLWSFWLYGQFSVFSNAGGLLFYCLLF